MYVSHILDYCEDDHEADIYVSDGVHFIKCYAYPINNVYIGEKVSTVFAYGCREIKKHDELAFQIEKLPQYYAYSIIAQVCSQQNSIVHIGGLIMQLDLAIPPDINNGDFISFSVLRLNVIFTNKEP